MPKREGVSSLVHCTAGGLAGAMEVTIMYPTEYVKTQMQLQKAEAGVMKYRNSWHCAKTIVAERGPLALYRGLTSLLLGTVPKTALRFTAFGFLKNAFRVSTPLRLAHVWLAAKCTFLVCLRRMSKASCRRCARWLLAWPLAQWRPPLS